MGVPIWLSSTLSLCDVSVTSVDSTTTRREHYNCHYSYSVFPVFFRWELGADIFLPWSRDRIADVNVRPPGNYGVY